MIMELRTAVRLRIRNGEITERGLARRVGVSQVHIHNVLKGARAMTPALADKILDDLGISLLDLIDRAPRKGPGSAGGAGGVGRRASEIPAAAKLV
jgi:transcriptional regulator with XRE-family HTH domain